MPEYSFCVFKVEFKQQRNKKTNGTTSNHHITRKSKTVLKYVQPIRNHDQDIRITQSFQGDKWHSFRWLPHPSK